MDALLERLAAVYWVSVCLVALLPVSRLRALGGAGLALLGLAAAADAVAASDAADAFTSINELLAFAGAGLILGAAVSWLRAGRAPRAGSLPPDAESVSAPPFDPLILVGLGLAAFAPHLLGFALGTALALAGAARVTLRARQTGWLLPLLAGAVSFGAALTLMLAILGSEGGGLHGLADGPFSLAAERLLVLLLGTGALLCAGLPPLHRAPWGRGVAPLAALTLARLVGPALPAGLAVWQAPAMLLLTGGLLWSALTGRWSQVAVAGGLLTLWSGAAGAGVPGVVLVLWGWLVEIGTATAARRGISLDPRRAGLAVVPAGLVALPALTAGLRVQVLLSVTAALGCAAGLMLQWQRGPRRNRAPLY